MSTEIKPGDRVRVVNPIISFGDYAHGHTAVVDNIDEDGDLWVTWDRAHATKPEDQRLKMLFVSEVELA